MKKRLITILGLVLVINIMILFNNKNNNIPVFAEEDNKNNDHTIYNLLVEDTSITTKNLYNHFYDTDIKILGIYPKLNYLYKNKIFNRIGYYSFKKPIFHQNILEFETYFKKMLKDYGLNSEIEKIELTGIGISKIKIYASKKDIKTLLNKNRKIKIEK